MRVFGVETAIGQVAYDAASKAVQNLFGKSRKTSHLDYNEATEALADDGDASAKQARSEAYAGSAAIIRADERQVQPHSRQKVTAAVEHSARPDCTGRPRFRGTCVTSVPQTATLDLPIRLVDGRTLPTSCIYAKTVNG